MKKTILAMAIILSCAALAGCGGETSSTNSTDSVSSQSNSASLADRSQELLDTVSFPALVEVTSDRLEAYFGIDSAKVTEFSAYICGSGAMPDEFGVFAATDDAAAEEIAAALEERISKQNATFTDYTPDEMYKFDDCFAEADGNMVYYAICADNAAAKDILRG